MKKQLPNNAIYYFYRGFSYFKTNNNQLALEDNTTAIRLNPAYASAFYNRSIINKAIGKYREALDDALKAQSNGYVVNANFINELKQLIH
jgi:tetratricopeptide (TPR) repeat protein